MQKWKSSLSILLLSLPLTSCAGGKAPTLKRDVKIFTYLEEQSDWCRMNGEKVECAGNYKDYSLLPSDDVSMVFSHIVDLHSKCKDWEEAL